MKKSIIYSLKWIKQYFLNRAIYILLTVIVSIIALGYFNVVMSGEIKAPLKALNQLNDAKYVYTGITNHSNYDADNFYQQIDKGHFYSKQSANGELTDRVDALALKRLKDKEYNTNISPIEQCILLNGRTPISVREVTISNNIANEHSVGIGDIIYYVDGAYRTEYTVCGILEEFYGAFDIEIKVNKGLMMLHEEAYASSSTFVHFFESADDATYSKVYIKNNDLNRLNAFVKSSVRQNITFSISIIVLLFFMLHFNIKKYIARLRQENCSTICIFVFLAVLVISILLIVFVPITLLIISLNKMSHTIMVIIGIEFAISAFLLIAIYTVIFLIRRRVK